MPRKPRAKGKMAVGDNLYVIKGSYWFRFTYKGKTYTKRIGRVNEIPLTSARHIANKLKTRIVEGIYLEREQSPLFRDLARQYLEWYKTDKDKQADRDLRRQDPRLLFGVPHREL